jgi:hypothetical protein
VFRQHLKAKANKPTVLPNQHLRRQILPVDLLPLQQLRQRVELLLRLGAVPERDVAPRGEEGVCGVRSAESLVGWYFLYFIALDESNEDLVEEGKVFWMGGKQGGSRVRKKGEEGHTKSSTLSASQTRPPPPDAGTARAATTRIRKRARNAQQVNTVTGDE